MAEPREVWWSRAEDPLRWDTPEVRVLGRWRSALLWFFVRRFGRRHVYQADATTTIVSWTWRRHRFIEPIRFGPTP